MAAAPKPTGMTPELKAAIEKIFELSDRVRHVEGLLEGLVAQGTENARLMQHLKRTTDHVLRLVRQKEALLEACGRLAIEQRAQASGPSTQEFAADVERALREMRSEPH